jgi:1-acyl-sn-glycerol-3-phosphate acyltransferase
MKVAAPAEPYVPQLGFAYPEAPDAHMVVSRVVVDEVVLDKDYPFIDKSLWFKIRSWAMYLGIYTLVFVISPIRYGLRIEGREILKKNRKLFRDGALTVTNHVHRWDFLFLLQAVRFRRLYFPAYPENLTGPDRNLIRQAGGIPVPKDIHTIRYFNQAFDELHEQKKWFHVFPESSSWPYYQPIRPFKKGMFALAYKYNLPVIPTAISYREPTGVFKLFKKNLPLITFRMGEPILPDLSKPRKEAVALLRQEVHRKVVELAGIRNNPYPPEGD